MTKKSNIIPFPKTNIREVKIKDIAEELEGDLGIWSNSTFFKLS